VVVARQVNDCVLVLFKVTGIAGKTLRQILRRGRCWIERKALNAAEKAEPGENGAHHESSLRVVLSVNDQHTLGDRVQPLNTARGDNSIVLQRYS
jgi:hypothetical protein